MITYSKYTKENDTEFEGNNVHKFVETNLEAKLRFNKEVAQEEIADVKERMDYKKSKLRNYLEKVENISYKNDSWGFYRNCKPLVGLRMRRRSSELGLDVKVLAISSLTSKQMLDLNALNNFILTGEYPKKE
jgi:hypothetical protein